MRTLRGMALLIRSVEKLDDQVTKLVVEGEPISASLSIAEVRGIYQRLARAASSQDAVAASPTA